MIKSIDSHNLSVWDHRDSDDIFDVIRDIVANDTRNISFELDREGEPILVRWYGPMAGFLVWYDDVNL